MISLFLKLPKVIFSSIYDNISESAKKANMTVKEFVSKEDNIEHVSLIVYDVLPLVCKLGLRYQKFSSKFHQYFKHFRDMIYTYENTTVDEKTSVISSEKENLEQNTKELPEQHQKEFKKTRTRKPSIKKIPAKLEDSPKKTIRIRKVNKDI